MRSDGGGTQGDRHVRRSPQRRHSRSRPISRWSESKGGSVDDWLKICADNIAFGSLAQGRPEGARYLTAYRSRDALKDYFAGLARDWEMIEYVTEQFVAQGDRVVMLGRCTWRNKKTGKVVSTPKADSWRFANGKAVEFYRVLRHRPGARRGGLTDGDEHLPGRRDRRDRAAAAQAPARCRPHRHRHDALAGEGRRDRGARRARRGGRCARRRGVAAMRCWRPSPTW